MVDTPQYLLIELPARQLLDKFGSGGHKPGSGSAAALMGILSGKLLVTVCKLSLTKPKYRSHFNRLNYLVDQVNSNIEPSLYAHFQRDAETFAAVIGCRKRRDKATTEEDRRLHRREELEHLRVATEIPLAIGQQCLSLIDHAMFTFDYGFQSARGDSGAAASAAIAAVTSAAFVANLNLKSFGPSKWQKETFDACQNMLAQLQEKQATAFTRLAKLRDEEIRSLPLDLG